MQKSVIQQTHMKLIRIQIRPGQNACRVLTSREKPFDPCWWDLRNVTENMFVVACFLGCCMCTNLGIGQQHRSDHRRHSGRQEGARGSCTCALGSRAWHLAPSSVLLEVLAREVPGADHAEQLASASERTHCERGERFEGYGGDSVPWSRVCVCVVACPF